jgi:UDP-glucose 4-epimerase
MTILLTGGCGYIGTHMAWALHHAGEKAVILDDLSTGRTDGVPPGMPLVCGDMGSAEVTRRVLREHCVSEVIHLAGRRRIAESVADPLDCYRANVAAMAVLLGEAVRAGVRRVIFSSAAVYGAPASALVGEDAPKAPLNPYGWSKLMGERMLADAAAAHGLRHAILRYFNVAGADMLVRAAAEAVLGRREALEVFGTDWPTRDGSCIRDFIHVSDLVDVHLEALRHLRAGGADLVLNCGSGQGTSVLDVVAAFERATGRALPVRHAPRRPGDTAEAVADTGRLARVLGWRPRFAAIDIIVEQALRAEGARPAPGTVAGDAGLEAFVAANLDRAAYLDAYPDVAAAGMDPVDHWLDHGLAEGRMLAPGLVVQRGAAACEPAGEGWARFTWHGEAVAVRIDRRAGPAAAPGAGPPDDGAAFAAFVATAMDRRAYLDAYADVAAAGVDPVQHWLGHGMREGRFLAPGLQVRRGGAARAAQGPAWQHFTWRGEPVAVSRREDGAGTAVMAQILAQARHEPAVLAAGARAIGNLRRYAAPDLLARNGLQARSLLDAAGAPPDVVLMVPWLVVGGADKYGADLADALLAAGRGPVTVLVTDQTSDAATGWEDLPILAPYRNLRVVFWRDHSHAHRPDVMSMARFLNALRPRALVVINSRIGLDAVARFGRGLSQSTRILCAYFSMGVDGLGAPHGTRFPRRTLPFAMALTDNEPMAARLRSLHTDLPGQGIALLPARVAPAGDETFAARLAARQARVAVAPRPRRWAWVSRIEPWKGTAVLAALARRRPQDRFDLYGPVEGTIDGLGLSQPNIRHHGILPDVLAADFTGHDGFLFTSLFEGMPLAVLEMSQHAIPMVLAEVGGLRDTFDDAAATFVRHGAGTAASAAAFDAALDRVLAMPVEAQAGMVIAARARVLARHSPAAHARHVATLFGAA